MYDDEVSEIPYQETVDSLAEMYELLDEDDLAAGLWQKKAKFQETITAISYEQQGIERKRKNKKLINYTFYTHNVGAVPIYIRARF